MSVLALSVGGSQAEDDMRGGFINPPTEARPGAYWCWLNGGIGKEQITRDLEEMKAKGVGGAEIWDVQALKDPEELVPAGSAFMGDESVDLIVHAIREGTRLGLRLGLIASSGWNARLDHGGPTQELDGIPGGGSEVFFGNRQL